MVDLTCFLIIYGAIFDNKKIRGKWNFNIKKHLVYPTRNYYCHTDLQTLTNYLELLGHHHQYILCVLNS